MYKMTEEHKQKISKSKKGKIYPKISLAKRGKPNLKLRGYKHSQKHNDKIRNFKLGKELSLGTCQKISEAKTGFKYTEKSKKLMSENGKGKNKGQKRTPEQCRRISENKIGIKWTEEHRQNMSKIKKDKPKPKGFGKKLSKIAKIIHNKPEIKLRHRQGALKRIEENYGVSISYNKNSIPIFQEFKRINNLKNCYFATSPKEYQILGYSLDFIDFDLKLIIEIDEKHHKYRLKKDQIRQQEIQEYFSDFEFLRFKEEEMDKILEIKL